VGPPFGGAAPSGGGFFRSRAWRPQTRPAAAAEDAADHDSNARIVEADNPVYAKTFPFNLIYMHHSTWVIPLDPRSPGKHSGAMYLTLLGLCLTVWWAWQLAQMPPGVRAPVTPEEMAQLVSTERDARGNIESLVHGLSQADVNYVARKMDWMFDNFTVNCSSVVHRPWTIFTSALSHQGLDHLAGNFLSLFIFAPKVYNFLGPRYFTGLYLAGAAGCSLMHATLNAASGRTDPPLRYAELIALSDQVSDERATEIVKSRDTPCLGASGSCMSVWSVSASQCFISCV
jgi:membrane associated rhomboid family serine protease